MMRNAKAMTTNRGHAGENLPVKSDLLLYRTEDGRTRIEVRLQDETVWMTQATMGELYQTSPQNITLHLKSLYEVGELGRMATCKKYLQVQHEGEMKVRRALKFYNLPAILAVGYRVRSPRGVQFRRWATEKLNAFLRFNERDILEHAGTLSIEIADKLAQLKYDKFNDNRLALEAEAESQADDAAFESWARKIEQSHKDKAASGGKDPE